MNHEEIEFILHLHNMGYSQRAISRMTKHSRLTVRKYIWLYKSVTTPVRVFSINIFLAWLFLITVIALALLGVYEIIN